jgi:hypothetical protein
MATRAVRRLQPSEIRHFGSRRASHNIPDLTEIQTRFYDAFLQYDVPAAKRKDHGIEGVLREIFPDRELRPHGEDRVSAVRTRQATVQPRRVSPAAAHVWAAASRGLAAADPRAAHRGGGLSRRRPDHAGRRRVHHQRCRAGGGEPAAPVARHRLRGRHGVDRPQDVQLPDHPRARQLDRAQCVEEGHAPGANRPERQVLGPDAPAGDGPEVHATTRRSSSSSIQDREGEDRGGGRYVGEGRGQDRR